MSHTNPGPDPTEGFGVLSVVVRDEKRRYSTVNQMTNWKVPLVVLFSFRRFWFLSVSC